MEARRTGSSAGRRSSRGRRAGRDHGVKPAEPCRCTEHLSSTFLWCVLESSACKACARSKVLLALHAFGESATSIVTKEQENSQV